MKQNAGPIAIAIAVVFAVGLIVALGIHFMGPTVATSDHPQIPAYAQQMQKSGTAPASTNATNHP